MKKAVFICVLLFTQAVAFSFPFRGIERGKEIPSVKLKKTDGTSFSISPASVKGKGLILLFWGVDSVAMKKRAIEVMKILNRVMQDNKEIQIVAINAQGNKPEAIREVSSQVKPHYPVLLDERRKACGAFGVFVTPSILMVNGQGRVTTGFGYSNTILDKIETEVLILLGEISQQEAKKRLELEFAEKPKEERKALMHLELGRRMETKGMPRKAKEEYLHALQLFDLREAHVLLGMLLVEENDIEGAQRHIKEGLTLDANALDGKIAYAKLRVAKGDLEGVVEELQALSLESPKNYVLRYALGEAYEAKGELKNAAVEYKKAFELLRKGVWEDDS